MMETDWFDEDCLYVDKRDRMGKVQGWLYQEKDETPVVCDDGRPFGLIDQRAIMRQGYDPNQAIDKSAWPVPVLAADATPAAALKRFSECHAPYLPVHRGEPKQEAGVLWAGTLLQNGFDEGPNAIGCSANVTTLGLGSDLNRAIRGFSQDLIDRLPVAGPRGPAGVVHRRDVLRWVHEANLNMGRDDRLGNVTGVLAEPITNMIDNRITTVDQDAGFDEVKEALHQDGCAFVTNGNRLEGALTPAGVLAAIHKQQNAPYHGVTPHFTLPRHR